MPLAFMPSRSARNTRARPYNTRHTVRGRVVARRPVTMRNHLLVMITTIACSVLLLSFLVYDLYRIYRFRSEQNRIWSSDVVVTGNQNHTQTDIEDLIKKYEGYNRQRALAATLMVLLVILAATGIAVYVGFKKKIRYLLVGYLVMTFPVMTFSMVYAIIFMVDASSTYVYVKIVTVIFIYTIQANMYRLVYRLYQGLKYDARRTQRQGENNGAYREDRNGGDEPVVIQMNPPPYEKEPPPYSVEIPSIHTPLECDSSLQQNQSSRYISTYGIGNSGVNPSVFDLSPEAIQYRQPSQANLLSLALSYSTPTVRAPAPAYSVGDLSIVETTNVSQFTSNEGNILAVSAGSDEPVAVPYTISVAENNAHSTTMTDNSSAIIHTERVNLTPPNVQPAATNSVLNDNLGQPPPYSES